MSRRLRLEAAAAHLRKRDRVLKAVITAAGPCGLSIQRDRFNSLVRAIIAQQISTAAARSIRGRLVERIGTPRPEPLLALTDEDFRSCGISPQKAGYLRDLSARVASGEVPLNRLGRFPDEEVIERLVVVKGIGRWTAQMFLIFSLGRHDVLPHDDLGIRNAMQRLYGLDASPRREEMNEIARPWRPHASIACWYLWRSLDAQFRTP